MFCRSVEVSDLSHCLSGFSLLLIVGLDVSGASRGGYLREYLRDLWQTSLLFVSAWRAGGLEMLLLRNFGGFGSDFFLSFDPADFESDVRLGDCLTSQGLRFFWDSVACVPRFFFSGVADFVIVTEGLGFDFAVGFCLTMCLCGLLRSGGGFFAGVGGELGEPETLALPSVNSGSVSVVPSESLQVSPSCCCGHPGNHQDNI